MRFFLLVLSLIFACASNAQMQSLGTPVNSLDNSEFAPTISADGKTLLFESNRGGEGWRLFISTRVNGAWTEPKSLDAINKSVKPENFLGGPCLSYDGNTLFFTTNKEGGVGGMDIWYCKRNADNSFSAPKNIGRPLNTGGYEGFASVSPDNKYLYFMKESNKPRMSTGQTCCKIYVAEKRGAFYVNPQPLPYPVNTGCEGYPRIMTDGRTLIFSSVRPGGKGGYDLYESKLQGGKWTKPEPLEFLNTDKDDQLIAVPASGDVIYFASTKSNSQDDIYKVTLPKQFRPEDVLSVQGVILNNETHKPIVATIKINNFKTKEKITEVSNDSLTGKYQLYLKEGEKYDVSISAKGYTFHSEVINTDSLKAYKEVKKNIEIKKLKAEVSFTLNNVFFDFDSSSLNKSSEFELNRVYDMLLANPGMKVEISAHTDDKGSDEYNDKLSQARAESVVNYLAAKGIVKERMIAKGYGKQKPCAPNDSEENRAKNRRVEFKILKL